jgi:hypothetical protein
MSSDTDATLEGVAAAAALAESELDKAVRELNEDASIMNPSNQTTYKVGTLSFSVDTDNPTVNTPTQVNRLYTKEHRPDVGSKEEKKLITSITVNQYGEFKIDAENLKNNLSITQRLQLTQECFERYDLLDPCNIIFPSENNRLFLLQKMVSSSSEIYSRIIDLCPFQRSQPLANITRST